MRINGSRRYVNNPHSYSCSTVELKFEGKSHMASTLSCCLVRTNLRTFQKGNKHLGITNHVLATLEHTCTFFISYNFSAPPTCRQFDRPTVSGLFKREFESPPLQLYKSGAKSWEYYEIPSIWPPSWTGKSYLKTRRKALERNTRGNPQEISQLCGHCLHDGCFCCPFWSQATQTSSASADEMGPALEDRSDFQQFRKQWHKDMFSSIFSSLREKPLDKHVLEIWASADDCS